MEHQIISNSSPIINLAKIEKLDLIEKLFKKIIIPEAVYKELLDLAISEGFRINTKLYSQLKRELYK